jgi:hypothetical protein
MLVEYDLNLIQGSTFNAQLTAKNEDGTAVDLTNFQVRGTIKAGYSDSNALVSLTLAVLSPTTSGIINASLTATQTAALPITQAVYDIEMYSAATGYVSKLLDGRVNIHPEVTTSS